MAGLPSSGRQVRFVQFTPDGKTLVGGGSDGVRTWEAATWRPGVTIPMNSAPGAISPDGRTLALLGRDGTLKLWDMTTGQELASATTDWGTWNDLAWSPDGKTLASCSERAPGVRLWDVTSGLKQHSLLPGRWVCSVAFSPDGKNLVVGGQFGGMSAFDAVTRQRKSTFVGI